MVDMQLSNNKLVDTLNVKIEKLEDQINHLKLDENDFKKNMCLKKNCSIKHVPKNNQN